jgi:hypothetical protein
MNEYMLIKWLTVGLEAANQIRNALKLKILNLKQLKFKDVYCKKDHKQPKQNYVK